VQDVENVYGISNDAARATVSRLTKDGFVKRTKKGEYRKQKTSLM
jgi:predicted transcriptional regulator of viral defense system